LHCLLGTELKIALPLIHSLEQVEQRTPPLLHTHTHMHTHAHKHMHTHAHTRSQTQTQTHKTHDKCSQTATPIHLCGGSFGGAGQQLVVLLEQLVTTHTLSY